MAVVKGVKAYVQGGVFAGCLALLLGCSGEPEIILPDGGSVADAVADLEERASGQAYADVLTDPTRHPIALARYIADHTSDEATRFGLYRILINTLSTHVVPEAAAIDVLLQAQWHLENSPHPDYFDPYSYELAIIDGYIELGRKDEALVRLQEVDQYLSQQIENHRVLNARYLRTELARKLGDTAFLEELVNRQTDPGIRAQWRAYLGLLYLEEGEEMLARRIADDINFRLGELRWSEMPLDAHQENYSTEVAYAALFDLFVALGDTRSALEVLELSYARVTEQHSDNDYWRFSGPLEYIRKFAEVGEFTRAEEIAVQVILDTEQLIEESPDHGFYIVYSGFQELADALAEFDMVEQQRQLLRLLAHFIMAEEDTEAVWFAIILVEFMHAFDLDMDIDDMIHHIRLLMSEIVDREERLVLFAWKLKMYVEVGRPDDVTRMFTAIERELRGQRAEDVAMLLDFIGPILIEQDRKDLFDQYAVPAIDIFPYLIHSLGTTLAEHQYYEDALALMLGRDESYSIAYLLVSIGEIYLREQRIPSEPERAVLKALYEELASGFAAPSADALH
ncbi:hypothetical protein FM042_10760 [Aliidiomarina halalkaliphila]|uniref:Uncharacterized protein n=1 Tax=Aliidiomarina halalkaliphila TaxID=2593535 RepID=A0A552WZV9_9GAMM|nr:hypothetical protein [Aliidiomarina halalkaliphila]TRW48129.1 hypothetical protein FM042_10760 [Aliidiomarina halalkaliphila]